MFHKEHETAGFTPFGHRVLLKIHKAEEKTTGGIIIPDEILDREKQSHLDATILAIGETAFAEYYVRPNVGDTVKIVKYAGHLYDGDDGDSVRIVNDSDIVAINKVYNPQDELAKAIKLEQTKEQANDRGN